MSTDERELLLGVSRVSTPMQVERGRSLSDQERRMRQHAAAKMGGKAYDLQIEVERGVSGTWTIRQLRIPGVPVREALSDVVDRCVRERPHALLVDTEDRLTREAGLWFGVYSMFLKPFGVKLWIVDGDLDLDNPDDEMVAGFRALLSQAEVRKMSQRALRFRRDQRAAGYPPGGRAGFGWRFETDEEMRRNGSLFRGLLPVPQEARWVKWIIRQYVERGRTILDICADLNDRQVPHRDSEVPWYAGRVGHVLNHPFHFGLVKDNDGGLHQGAHYKHRYFDPDVYYTIQDIKRQRVTRGPRTLSQPDAPLLGVIRCGMCGQRLQLARDQRGQALYICPKPQEGERRHCVGLSKRADAVERVVAQAIGEIVAAPKLREMVRAEASQLLGEHKERLQCRRQQLQSKLEDLDRRLNEWATKYTDGDMSEAVFLRVSGRWEKQRQVAEEELAGVACKLEQGDVEDRRVQRVMAALDSFQETWQRMEAPRLRQLLLTMIESMTLEPDGNSGATLRLKCHYIPEITYHIPHLRAAVGEEAGRLAQLTFADLAFRGLKPKTGYSYVHRIRARTGMHDLDQVAQRAQPLIAKHRPLLPLDRRCARPSRRPQTEPTERELEVAGLRAQGLSHRQIAQSIGVKEGSVANYFASLKRKLGAKSPREVLMILAAQRKLSLPDAATPDSDQTASN